MGMSPRTLRPRASGLTLSQLRQGLALYLPLNETATSGNVTAVDNSGNGFNFTSVNSTLSTTGVVGNGRNFIKTNQNYLLGGSTSSLLAFGENAWSLAFWLKFTTLPTTGVNQSVMSRNVNASGGFNSSEFGVQFFSTAGVTNLNITGANTVSFAQFGAIVAGTWCYIVLTNSGKTITYYRDGALVGTGTRTGTWLSSAQYTVIGIPNTNAAAGQAIDGALDEFAKWNRTLSANEVAALYNRGLGRSLVV